MTTLLRILILLVCFSSLAFAAANSSFTLAVKGKELTINSTSDRTAIKASLENIFAPEEPSVSTPERIQYDFIAVEGQAPAALVFDFDKHGKWIGTTIDANMKVQNPVAQQVVSWLHKKGIKGKKSGKTTTWKHEGLVYRLREVKDAGEDSMYSLAISKK